MTGERRVQLTGLDYLAAITALTQRVRQQHATKGLYEAAELQWWWRTPRTTDTVGHLFWFDGDPDRDADDRPIAAAILTDWGDHVALGPITLPDAKPEMVALVFEQGIAHAATCGIEQVQLEVDRTDTNLLASLSHHGFAITEGGLVENWLAADARPEVSPLHSDYELLTRLQTLDVDHHMISRSGPDVGERLAQTSLYRPDLDLLVRDRNGDHAAHGLFWFDPVTNTGVVEPMRTEDGHQQQGLARHVLTTGVELLARAGATRIKICFEAANAAAEGLYLSVGFEPVKQTDIYGGPTSP